VKLAALDAGSNTFHLVVAEVRADGSFDIVDRAKEMVRIGESTLRTRVIPTDGFERGIDALRRLRRMADGHKPVAVRAVATAAIREALNGASFVRAARELAGIHLQVVDAAEEARLVYLGARRGLGLTGGKRVALFDLGGGSLEIILADASAIHYTASLPLGGLRLADKWLSGDPPDAARLALMRAAIRAELAMPMAAMEALGYDFVALASGTANALRGILAARAGTQDGTTQRPGSITLATLRELERDLTALPAGERWRVPGLDPGRVDTVVPGAAVLRLIVEMSGLGEATFANGAIREGIIMDQLSRRWPQARAA
jgi:exopolyphosphatase / guanosine-5'-triphosphate,3'-diphosphate pyrophosphatase